MRTWQVLAVGALAGLVAGVFQPTDSRAIADEIPRYLGAALGGMALAYLIFRVLTRGRK